MDERKGLQIKGNMLTIPNMLSLFRVLLIPVIIWLYCGRQQYAAATGILLLSGLTDIADGYIARHFNMTSDLGKMIDPVADKLTQFATLICLGTRFPLMLLLAAILAVKEISTGIFSLIVVNRTNHVKSADWHGKLVTFMLYLTMIIHILWIDIPHLVTVGMTAACLTVMLVSFTLYLIRNKNQLKEHGAVK